VTTQCSATLPFGILWGFWMVPSELHIHKQLQAVSTAVGKR